MARERMYSVEAPPVEEFLPPPPDEVAKEGANTMASLLDGLATVLRGPADMVQKMANDMRRKRF